MADRWPPEWWWHERHGLHDEAHHKAHRSLDLCVPLNSAQPPTVDAERLARVEREDTHREFVRVHGFDPYDLDGAWRAGFDAGVEAQEKRIAYIRDVMAKLDAARGPEARED